MNIKLSNVYSIKSDTNNIMLVKTVKERETILSYSSTLESCIMGYFELKIRLSDSKSIDKLIEEIKSLQQALTLALTPFKIKVEVAK